jgi:hypothetical protein
MLPLLPRLALVVADAGYYGYELLCDLLAAHVFLTLGKVKRAQPHCASRDSRSFPW